MLHIKKLYRHVLQSFIPVFAMTFTICLFIVLMQFLWKYVEEFVGKGLDLIILGEMFFYAALNLVPMALPLAILLAALMLFGSMGEKLELLAVKASGVSLLKMMRPLIIFIAFISIGAFFYQNEAMPRINVKFKTLLNSIRQKSLELNIPEGAFYSIDTRTSFYNVFVKQKDPLTGMLRGFILYDVKDFNNAQVIVSDSATIQMSENKDFLVLTMFDGQQFSLLDRKEDNSNRRQAQANNQNQSPKNNVKESFKTKKIIINFDGNFSRLDESGMEGSQLAKNLTELGVGIDSMRTRLDTLNTKDLISLNESYLEPFGREMTITENIIPETYTEQVIRKATEEKKENPLTEENKDFKLNIDSLIQTLRLTEKVQAWDKALNQAQMIKTNMNTYESVSVKNDLRKSIRQHHISWHQMFTLSFACIIFFFIGAPLGAIIRKGGLGMPVVVSVILFIVYYIVNNIGIKMARDGVWPEWEGMWLSTVVLFPLGAFLTYKSMKDSALFNAEAYGKIFRKVLRIESKVNNEDILIDIRKIPELDTLQPDQEMLKNFEVRPNDQLRDIAQNYERYGYNQQSQIVALSILKSRGETLIDTKIYYKNYALAEKEYLNMKKSSKLTFSGYILTLLLLIVYSIWKNDATQWLFIFSLIAYIVSFTRTIMYYTSYCKYLLKTTTSKSYATLAAGTIFYVWLHPYLKKKIDTELKKKEHIDYG